MVHIQIRDFLGRLILDRKLGHFPISIGRHPKNNLVLPDPSISRHHVVIEEISEAAQEKAISEEEKTASSESPVKEDPSIVRLPATNSEVKTDSIDIRDNDDGKPAPPNLKSPTLRVRCLGARNKITIAKTSMSELETEGHLQFKLGHYSISILPFDSDYETTQPIDLQKYRKHKLLKIASLSLLGIFVLSSIGGGALFLTKNGGFSYFTSPASNGDQLTSQFVEKLNRGVFEIVFPKKEDDFVKYKEKLPVELLPFQKRNDKFISIGTAFAISKHRLVTAAHVMGAHRTSHKLPLSIRDKDGNIYEITKIIRYSQHRDLVEFEVNKKIKDVYALKIETKTTVGEKVFTVGNAHGQGIAVRSGVVTSYTPESIEGAWNNIRYSAGASPGNSGGPLLQADGKVVGVVTKTITGDTLAFATPIDELKKLSEKEATFLMKNWAEEEANERLPYDIKFNIDLPQTYATLRDGAEKEFLSHILKNRKAFEEKFASKIFPKHEKLAPYFREQSFKYEFGTIDIDSSNAWGLYTAKLNSWDLGEKQKLYFGKLNDGLRTIILERPQNKKLENFFEDSKYLMDTVVQNVRWSREFSGRQIMILSYGPAQKTDSWKDTMGRRWTTWTWRTQFDQGTHAMHCLPYPKGLACLWRYGGSGDENIRDFYDKKLISRIPLSYDGSLTDWQEYLALPNKFKSEALQSASLKLTKLKIKNKILKTGVLDFDFGPLFNGRIRGITSESLIYVGIGFSIKDPTKSEIYSTSLKPDKDKTDLYSLKRFIEPLPMSVDSAKSTWKMLSKKQAPYNGTLRDSNETLRTYQVKSISQRSPASGKSAKELVLISCQQRVDVGKNEFKRNCSEFNNSGSYAVVR